MPDTTTQTERHRIIRDALWFSAHCYEAEDGHLLVHIDPNEAASAVLALLDSKGWLKPLAME